ncbi:hypothetical protein E4U53_005800 [Claviceps sorghi]|nr:hypothetical protein E4U53_005800 [Claviceps sorghi]
MFTVSATSTLAHSLLHPAPQDILHSLRLPPRILQQQPENPTSRQSRPHAVNMVSTTLYTVFAVGASLAAAGDTVFLTAKTTQTKTVTHCADSYTGCPLHKTSAAAATTAAVSSSSAAAGTSVDPVATSVARQVPTAILFPTADTTVSRAPTGIIPASSTTGPILMPTGAASGLRAQNAAVVVAAAAAAAAAAAMVC